MSKLTPRTMWIGIVFLFAWIVGAFLVEGIHMPVPLYAILVIASEIAFLISLGYDILGNNEKVC